MHYLHLPLLECNASIYNLGANTHLGASMCDKFPLTYSSPMTILVLEVELSVHFAFASLLLPVRPVSGGSFPRHLLDARMGILLVCRAVDKFCLGQQTRTWCLQGTQYVL